MNRLYKGRQEHRRIRQLNQKKEKKRKANSTESPLKINTNRFQDMKDLQSPEDENDYNLEKQHSHLMKQG
uniref:Uncharacterized protein n=1 Tax=Nelumbo nucifera TaxID=4432 RepID=A0A822XCU3_NELNU|nr:TPA_asm: hypothetical protein HUJ06_020717 [Nelumbo nucifera]